MGLASFTCDLLNECRTNLLKVIPICTSRVINIKNRKHVVQRVTRLEIKALCHFSAWNWSRLILVYKRREKITVNFKFAAVFSANGSRLRTRIIIWQAPRAGSMQRILCSDWLPERARWSDTARLGLPVSFPQIKFRQSSSECTKVFFSPKLLSAKVKRIFEISLSLWNQKKRQREWNKENKNVDKF